MDRSDSFARGVTLGLLTVLAIIIIGAILGQEHEQPAPAPSPDRSVIIVPQRSPK